MDKSLVDQIYKGDLVITISGLIKFVQSLPLALINKKALAQPQKKHWTYNTEKMYSFTLAPKELLLMTSSYQKVQYFFENVYASVFQSEIHIFKTSKRRFVILETARKDEKYLTRTQMSKTFCVPLKTG